MPRTKDEIWKQFSEVTLANGTIRAECKGCKASIVGLVSRMKTHFEACSKKRAAPQNTTDDEPTPKQTKQSTLPILTSGTKQHEIHLQIARCIIATGSAFRSVENKQFKNMVQLLRTGTVLPTRQLVSGTLLDEIYDIEKAKVSALVTGLEGTLLVDGWSDLTNHPVIGVAFVTNGQCYLVTSVDTTGTPHTSENLADIVKEQKLECEATYNVKIGSLVCDNAANMVRMREILTNDIGIHVFGCGAHFLNLLAKDNANP